MGDWTLSSGSCVRPYRSDLGHFPIRHYQASTAVSTARIIRGDVVEFDHLVATATFRVRRDLIASTTPSTGIVGIALGNDTFSDAAGTGLTTNGQSHFVNAGQPNTVPVCLARHTEFIGHCTGVSNSTMLGQAKVLTRDSTLNIWVIQRAAGQVGESTLSDQRIVITEVPYPGDTNGPLVFRFLQQNPQPSSVSTAVGYLAFNAL